MTFGRVFMVHLDRGMSILYSVKNLILFFVLLHIVSPSPSPHPSLPSPSPPAPDPPGLPTPLTSTTASPLPPLCLLHARPLSCDLLTVWDLFQNVFSLFLHQRVYFITRIRGIIEHSKYTTNNTAEKGVQNTKYNNAELIDRIGMACGRGNTDYLE